jgi:hypothetical protein
MPDGRGYNFSPEESARYANFAWRFPVSFVTEGSWAELWKSARLRGPIASLLPILCLHTFRGFKQSDDPHWTGWQHLGIDKLAVLGGVSKSSVHPTLSWLEDLLLLQLRQGSRRGCGGNGRHPLEYRMSLELYATERGTPFRVVPPLLFYGGMWRFLPRASARQLLITMLALDPIADEQAFVRKHGYQALPQIRAERSPRLVRIQEVSGMPSSTLKEAMSILLYPFFNSGAHGYITRHEGNSRRAYYVFERRSFDTRWTEPQVSLRGTMLHQYRRQHFPELVAETPRRPPASARWSLHET